MMSKLALDCEQSEKAIAEHQHRIWQVSDRSVQDSVARSKELLRAGRKGFPGIGAHNLGEVVQRAGNQGHGNYPQHV